MIVDTLNLGGLSETEAARQKKMLQQAEENFAAMLREATPEEELSKITKEGVKSLMEHKIEALKKSIADKVMASKGLTMADLEAMGPEEKLATLQQIMKEVQEQLKLAISEQMKKEDDTELGFMNPYPFSPENMKQLIDAQELMNA